MDTAQETNQQRSISRALLGDEPATVTTRPRTQEPPRINTTECPDPTVSLKPNGKKKRHGARNQHRHKIFVKWLLDTFDVGVDGTSTNNAPTTRTGQHILDVAGGKGEVSARLCMCHCQQVIMVDPRPANIVQCYETLVVPKIPNKWQRRLQEQQTKNPKFVHDTIQQRFQQFIMTFDEQSIQESKKLQDAVQNASVLVGLHADGATEVIVDAALKYSKPFVVVPCCVFPNLFHDRRVYDDETKGMVAVRSHEQFCQYLVAKDPRFRIETLPFEGRNVAIWWNGQ